MGSINGSDEPISKPENAAFDNAPATGTTGQPVTFSIESKNDSGDVIETFRDRFVLKITRPDSTLEFVKAQFTGTPGTYTASFTPAFGGTYTVDTTMRNAWTAENLDESRDVGSQQTITVTPKPSLPANADVSIEPANPDIDDRITVTFTSRDEDDTDVAVTDDEFSVRVEDAYGRIRNIKGRPTSTAGEYKARFRPELGGDLKLTFSMENKYTAAYPDTSTTVGSEETITIDTPVSIPASATCDLLPGSEIVLGSPITLDCSTGDEDGNAITPNPAG